MVLPLSRAAAGDSPQASSINQTAESLRAGGGVPPKGKAIRRPDRRGGRNGVSDCEEIVAQPKLSNILGLICVVLFIIGPSKPEVEEEVAKYQFHIIIGLFSPPLYSPQEPHAVRRATVIRTYQV